ncbi:MAG: 50S ribosomal protein L23 [Candidatus Anstonellaceae archaeon]
MAKKTQDSKNIEKQNKEIEISQTKKPQSKKEKNQKNSSEVSQSSSSSQDIDSVLLYPITTEKVINSIESQNQLVFATKLSATKKQIKEEFERQFKVKVKKVNTKISPKGIKHAYIKLKEGKADDIAAQLKMI